MLNASKYFMVYNPYPLAIRVSVVICSFLSHILALNQSIQDYSSHYSMDTPPRTPPDSLHIHYCDFAYEHRGPFRMAVADVGETTAKTFAELIPLSYSHGAPVCLTNIVAPQTTVRLNYGYLRWQSQTSLVTSS